MSGLDPIGGALVDLDGTVYRGESLIPGADRGIRALRDRGVPVLFLSNNSLKSRAAYADKLTGMGLPAEPADILNSTVISVEYLLREHPRDEIYVIGESHLEGELEAAGLSLTDDSAAVDVVLVSMDRSLDYETLSTALDSIDEETTILATNPDTTCPVEGGEIPDAGTNVAALEAATGRDLDRVLGKPSSITVEAAADRLGVDASQCLMIGDRLETDVRMGVQSGMQTALVLSGVTDRRDLDGSTIQPDVVLESLSDLESVL
ncbi:HAD-IIA family hydrolase [Natrarchaeobius halalkaliphilus]|uniref:HAD-IIA family hydrolase n=1 Tax=Natrarchaeobius halalkaliphilus TaxID=1679091 RepID=A0A3N6MGC4_9EURY|nr:HAD-IIA family hydrolase [Natrarchaeobius halalkaliphilus]RQG92996.1 HAD-IIA family hydrolase [Natrarchaeobius halalkaliphilus]